MFFLFDFDGVLVDSAPETVFTSYNAFTGETVTRADELPPHYRELVMTNRPLVAPAGDFIVLTEILLNRLKVGNLAPVPQEEFYAALAAAPNPAAVRQRQFFDARARFQAKDLKGWFALHRVYEPLWGALRAGKFPQFALLTNKNRAAVKTLAEEHQFPLQDSQIYSGDGAVTKAENLAKLRTIHQADKFVFLDDQLINFHDLLPHFGKCVTPILAGWGYHPPEEAAQARAEGIDVLTQEEFLARFG